MMDRKLWSPTAPGRAIGDKLDAKHDVTGLNTCTPIVKFGVADLTKENAASFARKQGSKNSVETIQFSDENNPVWGGATGIIVRDFCGVAV